MNESDKDIKKRGAHFTPKDIADYIARQLFLMLSVPPNKFSASPHDTLTVLDPACGDGELLEAMLTILKSHGYSVRLVGVESDASTIERANQRLRGQLSSNDSLMLVQSDFLACLPEDSQPSLSLGDDQNHPVIPKADVIISNPPYVRTQIMGAGRSQELATRYGLKGKTDLYHAFFVIYDAFLKRNGVLGVITSNRYLYTKSGVTVREHLRDHFNIDFLVDLGDTKVFSAAVLPAIAFARLTNPNNEPISCLRVYETPGATAQYRADSVAGILDNSNDGYYSVGDSVFLKESGHIKNFNQSKEPWVLCSRADERWLDQIDKAAMAKLEDVAKVRVGIKTTADNVFIRDDWDTLEVAQKPEEELLRPLLSSKEACRWAVEGSPKLHVLYPHYSKDGKRKTIDLENYPGAKAYLLNHYEQLNARSYIHKSHRQWFEIWVPQNPSAWAIDKLVFPDISSGARFFMDKTGAIVDGNCYWITVNDGQDPDLLYLIMAVANSKLMDRYHSRAFQNVLYSGKRRYLAQYVNQYPIPDSSSEYAKRIISYLKERLDNNLPIQDSVIDDLVDKAFGA